MKMSGKAWQRRDLVHSAKYLSMILLLERKMYGRGDAKGKKKRRESEE